MQQYHVHTNPMTTPQTEPLLGEAQVPNSAGGYVYALDDWGRLDRFLILGAEGGTYYATERKLSIENAEAVLRCIKADGVRVVKRIVEISDQGRAPKNDPALFALALCFAHGDDATKGSVEFHLSAVARIPTHLAKWVTYVRTYRGFGRRFKRTIARWMTSKDTDNLAYQFCKYQSREGWSTKDLLRVSHPHPKDKAMDALFQWVCGTPERPTQPGTEGLPQPSGLPTICSRLDAARGLLGAPLAAAIREGNLTREMVPTESLNDPAVLTALMERQPITATIRNLGNMSKHGVLGRSSDQEKLVCERLRDEAQIRKGRLHPFSVLLALKTYQSGKGFKGTGEWEVNSRVVDALEDCYRLAFVNVEPAGKRILVGLDVSGSMSTAINNSPLSAREATTAIASILARTEPDVEVMMFSSQFIQAPGNWGRDSIATLCKMTAGLPFMSTDCSIPMLWAIGHKRMVDTFVVMTDNETFAGQVHPIMALRAYRKALNPKAKLIVAGMTSTGFTIADPNDAGSLDIVGLDAAIPQLIADFSR